MIRIVYATLFCSLLPFFAQAQLVQLINTSGQYRITADACGTNSLNCNIIIEKPANATTVHRAWVYGSNVPYHPDPGTSFVNFSGAIPPTTLNLNQVASELAPSTSFRMWTRYGDVTSVVSGVLNSAPAGGTTTFISAETNSNQIDGVGMIVVWNCPSQPNTIVHVSIGSECTGVVWNSVIPTPAINTSLPTYRAIVGTGYVFATATGPQISTHRVNGTIIDTQCGGLDDGGFYNGGLVTLGGFGDSPTTGSDELYDISALIPNGATSVTHNIIMSSNHNLDWLDALWMEIVNDVALPIELADFHATPVGEDVELTWVTNQEINSDYFEIERSSDGALFETLERVEGAGNTTTEQAYKVMDYDPLPGKSYYRLRNMDLDGIETYSEVETVLFGHDDQIDVYPSPAHEFFNFVYTGEAGPIHVEIYDLKGARMQVADFDEVGTGAHTRVDVSELEGGLYMVKFFFNGKQETRKVVVAQ